MARILPTTCCVLLGLALGTPGCVSETTSSQDFGDLNAREAKPQGSWQVLEGTVLKGYVVRFEEKGNGGQVLLSVRNSFNQDLGWVDQLGRAWRYRPHEDPEWISTGSTLQGVRQILKLGQTTKLTACDLAELPTGR